MNPALALGKFLDQPKLVSSFENAVPAIMIAGGAAYATKNAIQTPKEQRKKRIIQDTFVLTGTIGSALVATRGIGAIKIAGKTIFKGIDGLTHEHEHHEHAQSASEIIDKFTKQNQLDDEIKEILEKAKTKILSYGDIKKLFTDVKARQNGTAFLNELIPDPENIDSKHIFGEIKRLSLLGLVPVVGGITGGIAGDIATEKKWKEKVPNKIKEGSYQYLANIFLCNVGAGIALAIMEKAKIRSKAARAVGMTAGIIITGIIGGSAIANLIGNKLINPMLNHGHNHGNNEIKEKGLYSERKPEWIDVGLHVDDIATVGVMSGLKWIEPALPILYSISGYRAGIGYRNGETEVK